MKAIGKFLSSVMLVIVIYIGVNAVLHRDTNDRIISHQAALALQVKAERSALRTAFIADMFNGIRVVSLPIALFFGALGVIAIGFGAGHTQRVQINNKRLTYQPHANGRSPIVETSNGLLLDTATGIFHDTVNGNSHGNEYTPQLINGLTTAANLASIAQHSSGKANAAMTKGAVGHYGVAPVNTRRQIAQPEPMQIEQMPDRSKISFVQNVEQLITLSTPDEYVVGQNQETGAIISMILSKHVHALIAGSTGSGKTQLALTLMAMLKTFGVDVVVIDGAQGGDWREYDDMGVIEWHNGYDENGDCVVGGYLSEIEKLMDRRLSIVGETRSRNIGTYNERHPNEPMSRVTFFLEELGSMVEGLNKNSPEIISLKRIIRLSRKAGISIFIIDQTPDSNVYSQTVLGQLRVFCFQLSAFGASVIKMHTGVAETLDNGEFIDYTNTVYKTVLAEDRFPFDALGANSSAYFGELVHAKGGSGGGDGGSTGSNQFGEPPEPLVEPPRIDPYNISDEAAEYITTVFDNLQSWNKTWKSVGVPKGTKTIEIKRRLSEMGYV